ncbi:MAG: hypothetical protein H0Z29_07980 [Candidatus Marinimicrobia bacterium]|nr:hypothetical protein [Candidatus Neomarinimicrobiota bacterium]
MARHLLLSLIVLVIRIIIIILIKNDVYTEIIPASLTSRMFVTIPSVFDIAIAIFIISTLARKKEKLQTDVIFKTIPRALSIIIFPISAGLLLFNFYDGIFFSEAFNYPNIIRFISFVLTFRVFNLILDNIDELEIKSKRLIQLIYTIGLLLPQDIVKFMPLHMNLISLLYSPGTLILLSTFAFRKYLSEKRIRQFVFGSVLGLITIIFPFGLKSNNIIIMILPIASLWIGSIVIRTGKKYLIAAALLSFILISSSINFIFPSHKTKKTDLKTLRVGDLIFRYRDERVKDIGIKFLKVIEAANRVSRETFGLSPNVNELTIYGIGHGGLHATFPRSIVGNIPSENVIKNFNDKEYLENDSANFINIDPINFILYKYSYLYGIIEYYPWMIGPEIEGWTCFSAVVLSGLIHKKYGDKLWDPPHNYALLSEKIYNRSLKGMHMLWYNSYACTGFNLYNDLAKIVGIVRLYKARWQLTERRIKPYYIKSDPKKARDFIQLFGEKYFKKYFNAGSARFSELYPKDEYIKFLSLLGVEENLASSLYERIKNKSVNISIRNPKPYQGFIDFLISLLAGSFIVSLAQRLKEEK